ncbi:MAG: hypothetical protein H0Z24_05270 [Thermosipho sp. (in: Bacteria)]|nr:hypothetical protein [Thermosipho sp. (in: thermotogales)]
MKEFFTLLKYGVSSFQPQRLTSKNKKYSFLKNQLILSLISSLPLGILVFFFSKDLFTKLYSIDPQITKLMLLFWMTILSLFFIIGFVGMAMYSLSRNDEIELLLTMPIKRRTLTAYQLFVSTISQMFVLSFYFFIYLSYTFVTKENIILGLFKVFVHFGFLISLSSVVAILLGGKANKGIVRKINVFLSLAAIFFYFSIISFQNINVEQFQGLANILNFSSKPYNFLAWSFISAKTLIFSTVSLIFLLVLFSILSNKLAFEPVERRVKKEYKIKGSGSQIKAIYRKDFIATRRYEQFLYFILYPIGFGVFFSLINENSLLTIFTIIPITTFYVAFETAILVTAEVSNLETTLTYPIKFSNLMFPKIVIPTTINFLIMLVVILVSIFRAEIIPILFLTIPITFILFIMSSIIGAYFVLKNPPKTENMSKIFGVGQTFAIEGITMGTAFGAIFPLIFLSKPDANIKVKIISTLISITAILLSLTISTITFKKLKKLLIP